VRRLEVRKIFRTAVTDDGHLVIYCKSNGENLEIDFYPEAGESLRIALEKLKRPWLRSAELIVRTARKILKELFVRKGIKIEENIKLFGLPVGIFHKKASILGSPEAYVFIPDIVTEDVIMKYDVEFNDEHRNVEGISCIIVAAGATDEAIKKARKRVQVYDVHDGRKGDGYDSALLEVIMDSFFQIKFTRIA